MRAGLSRWSELTIASSPGLSWHQFVIEGLGDLFMCVTLGRQNGGGTNHCNSTLRWSASSLQSWYPRYYQVYQNSLLGTTLPPVCLLIITWHHCVHMTKSPWHSLFRNMRLGFQNLEWPLECNTRVSALGFSLMPSPSPHMRERRSGVLSDFSCHMGRDIWELQSGSRTHNIICAWCKQSYFELNWR